jgi:2-hydroxychromene-2-carboxylate isomerase
VKHITFYLDFISPYAYLAFEKMPEALMGHTYSVTYKPILFAALLKHHGQLGPAEIPAKREWTYRQVQWLALRHGVELQLPAAHPFNPLGLLRLALACKVPNRYVIQTLFRHAWCGGADAADPGRLEAIAALLGPVNQLDSDEVKARLKLNTDQAIDKGVFGVPTFEVDGKLFWGLDALPMLRDYLAGDAWLNGPAWDAAGQLAIGISRKKRPDPA